MAKQVKVWNGTDSINGVPAEQILKNRKDLANALGDIFLVMQGGKVIQIEIGSTIKSIYDLDEKLTIQEVAESYLIKREEEELRIQEERLTSEELQEQVALLSYDVMTLQTQSKDVTVSVSSMSNQSPKFKMIKIWYKKGFWTKEMVNMAVNCRQLTIEEYYEIINE